VSGTVGFYNTLIWTGGSITRGVQKMIIKLCI
jgi:hypothetical protein